MEETLIDSEVTYTLEKDGKFFIVEHVPARICRETGERYFAPETVERLQELLKGRGDPVRVIETPVYEYGNI